MKTVVAILIASIAVTAGAITVEGNKIVLDPQEQAKCEESGCMLIPIDKLMEKMEKVFEMGKAEGVAACKGRT